jgi:hypothetical protein
MTESEILPFLERALDRRFENDGIEYKTVKEEAPTHFYDTLSSFSNTREASSFLALTRKTTTWSKE